MALNNNKTANEIQTKWKFWKCPKCGSRVCPDRRYCVCHADLYGGILYYSLTEPPDILGKVNLDLPYFTCDECENCAYCASFGAVNKNPNGFGGLDCGYRNNSVRCQCCKIQIKSFVEFGAGDKAIKEGLKRLESYRGNL